MCGEDPIGREGHGLRFSRAAGRGWRTSRSGEHGAITPVVAELGPPGLDTLDRAGFAAEDKVAVWLRFRGTHSGEFLGFEATGRSIEYVSHEFYRIVGGLIAEEWICSDMATPAPPARLN